MTPEMRIDGLLKILFKDGHTKIIYATRIVSNDEEEHWKYVQKNGRTLVRESTLNPELWAMQLAKEYARRKTPGKIHWKYKLPNHTQNEKMVPEEIPESV